MLDFANCMREHGIDMPDPQFNGDGGGVFSGAAEGGAGTRSTRPSWTPPRRPASRTWTRCSSNMPPTDPAELEEEKQQMLDFAQCMRDHGIDFPDPQINTDGGGLQVQMGGPGMDADSPGVQGGQRGLRDPDRHADAAGRHRQRPATGQPTTAPTEATP